MKPQANSSQVLITKLGWIFFTRGIVALLKAYETFQMGMAKILLQ